MLLWLIVWLICGTPPLHEWNGWAVSLLVLAALDVIAVLKKQAA